MLGPVLDSNPSAPVSVESANNDVGSEDEDTASNWNIRPTQVICPTRRSPRKVSEGNHVFRLTSEARSDPNSIGYKLFRDGLKVQETDEILENFNEARIRVHAGYQKFPRKKELFKAYVESRTRLENSESKADRSKASRYSWRHVQECINNLSDQKRDTFAYANIDGEHSICGNLSVKLDKYLFAMSRKTLRETLDLLINLPYNLIPERNVAAINFTDMSVKNKRMALRKSLLEAYQRDCNEPGATEIPWSRINVIGWPNNVPVGFGNISSSDLDKIFQALDCCSVVFRKS